MAFLSTGGDIGAERKDVMAAEMRLRLCIISKICGSSSGRLSGPGDRIEGRNFRSRCDERNKFPDRWVIRGNTGFEDQVVE
jgi:hypothetical protein